MMEGTLGRNIHKNHARSINLHMQTDDDSTFGNFSQLEVLVVALRILCLVKDLADWSFMVFFTLLLGHRTGQKPEGNAGDKQKARGHKKTHPPSTHPAGIFRSDGHTFYVKEKNFQVFFRKSSNKGFA